MFVFGNFVLAVARLLDIILGIMYWLVLIRALISWVNPDPFNPVVQFLHRTTEPILQPVRRMMPPMAVDFSPIIAFFAIIFLQAFLVASLVDLGNNMRRSANHSQVSEIQLMPDRPVEVKEEFIVR